MAVRRGSHCVYDTRYHLAWAPKYGKWVLQGAIRERVGSCFARSPHIMDLRWRNWRLTRIMSICFWFSTTVSISAVVGLLKAVSAKEIREEFPAVRKQLWGGEFWEDGYFVRTVGDKVTAEVIRKYIRFHEAKKRGDDQLDLF